jgi:CBS domain-containing protein
MSRVEAILKRKGNHVHTIEADRTVFDAVKLMVESNVGSLIVLAGESIAGIITERDYLRRIVIEGRTSKTTAVRDVMSSRVVCVEPTEEVDRCLSLMTQERIRHLPVMDGDSLVGIVSIGDLVKFTSREFEIEARYLTDYISGKYPG